MSLVLIVLRTQSQDRIGQISRIRISPEKKKRCSHYQNVQSVEMIRFVIVCDVIHGEDHVI